MAEESVTPEAVNSTIDAMTPSQITAFRAKLDPELFQELYRAGLSEQAQSLFFSDNEWALLIAGLTKLVVLAFVLERGLAYIFDHPAYVYVEERLAMRPAEGSLPQSTATAGSPAQNVVRRSIKALAALGAAWALCLAFNFNLLAGLFPRQAENGWGILLTAVVVAGGSQGAVKLMQSVLGIRSDIRKAQDDAKRAEAIATQETAKNKQLEERAKKQRLMNEIFGQTVSKLLADKGKSTSDLAAHLSKSEAEVGRMLDGSAPFGEADKDKVAQFLGHERRKIFAE